MIDGVEVFYESGWELWRWTEETDDYGGVTEDWALQQTIDGRLRPLSGDKKLSAEKDTIFATHKFYCEPTDIKPGDQIRKDDVVYKVKFAPDIMDFGLLMQVELELVA